MILVDKAWNNVDTYLFITIVVVAAVAIGLYFLIPVLNKKKYEQQQAELKKREEIFKQNLAENKGSKIVRGKLQETKEETSEVVEEPKQAKEETKEN